MRYAISSSVKALLRPNNNALCVHYSTKQGRDSRFFAMNEMFRSRGLSALTSSPRRSNASALSGSANRGDFSRITQLEIVDSQHEMVIR